MENLNLAIIIGLMALIVFIYRFFFLLIPMLVKGIKTKKTKLIFDSFTMLV